MEKQEGGAKPTVLPHVPGSTLRLKKNTEGTWASDYTENNLL